MYIIGGKFSRQRLASPKGGQTRPTASRLRESLFNICQNEVEGAVFLDLYAGSGSIGFEALSRGAYFVTFVESNAAAAAIIAQNAKNLGVEKMCHIMKMDVFTALTWLEKSKNTFDLIYADPPYKTALKPSDPSLFQSTYLLSWMDEHSLIKSGGLLFIEEDKTVLLSQENFKQLQLVKSRKSGPALLHQYIVD